MTSQQEIKQFASLKLPKYRQKYGQFLVEGRKVVEEVFHSDLHVVRILFTSEYAQKHGVGDNWDQISSKDMQKISQFDTPPGVVAVVEIPKSMPFQPQAGLNLILDGISDPGNLGAILRIADWYGISQVLLSEDCVDVYNFKCLSASMGSFLRVQTSRVDLEAWLKSQQNGSSSLEPVVYGAYLNGTSIYEVTPPEQPYFLVIGSEAHGIREGLKSLINSPITIPARGGAESLNASVATAILIDRLMVNIHRNTR